VTTMLAPAGDATFHAVQRRLAEALPDAATLAGGGPLEHMGLFAQERPRLDPAELIEDDVLRAHPIAGEPTAHFAAFLDGTQTSRVAQYIGGIPVVHGSVAAVIRRRADRRMTTWRAPLLRRRLFAPLSLLPARVRAALGQRHRRP
jgi:hypothetical protein